MIEGSGENQQALLAKILETEPGLKTKLNTGARSRAFTPSLECKSAEGLMAQFSGLHACEAQRLKGRVEVASAALMRGFREQRLSASVRRASDELKGGLALTTGPTYENQFLPSWASNTHPQAVDATTSPAAYLIDMLAFARDHVEAQGDPDKTLTLQTRRPDLFDLCIDEQSMHLELTQVEVASRVLERAIDEHQGAMADEGITTQDKLLDTRYPLKLFPYEAYWQQIRTVLAHNQLSMSDVVRLADIDSPYFIQPGAHSKWSDAALQQESSLGPALRALLIEAPYFGGGIGMSMAARGRRVPRASRINSLRSIEPTAESNERFFHDNFGVPGFSNLQKVVSFCQALQMNQDEMESLFGLAAHAPIRSENVPEKGDAGPVTADLFGARFINSGEGEPVAVATADQDPQHHAFERLTESRCDRLNRLVRLAHALQLSYTEVDQVVCAAIDAEKRAVVESNRIQPAGTPLWMSANTVRALGLFQFLRERFACSAEDFSALLSDMAVYGTADTPSHFDRVFNSDTTSALVLDGGLIDLSDEFTQGKLTVDQLCSGLGINMETFRYLSRLVMQGQGSERLTRSLPTISAFYRVTMLAKLLSITTIELLSLLETLSPEGLYGLQLAGVPQNAMYQSFSQTDTVSVIHAICHCVLWCQEQELPISWLVQQLLPVETADVVPEEVSTLFGELKSQLLPFQELERSLAEAGVPALKTLGWQAQLKQIVDEQGLINDTGNSEEDFDPLQYENFASREISVVIEHLASTDDQPDNELPALTADEAEHLRTLILGVVLRARSQQWGVVQERLSQLLGLNAERVIPVIYWAEGKVHTLLASAASFDPTLVQSQVLKSVMPLIQRMQRYARVASQFELSPAFFSSLLVRAQQPRFSLNSTDLSLHTLYFLERYTRCLRLARQSETQLLGYFSLVEAMGSLTPNEQRLIKDAAAEKIAGWLGWGIREVLDVAARVSPDGIIRNLAQLCALVDTRQLCEKTGLSAASLMNLSRLSPHSDTPTYQAAAQEVLSSLRRDTEQRRDEAELRQSLSSRCMVSEQRLIARKRDEFSTVTLRLLDMNNQPVSDIRVAWATDLGTLLDHYSYTDADGVATVQLLAGREMGVAHVKGTYLLDSSAFAPPVMIDCDEESLGLWPIEGKPWEPWELAGNRGQYRFSALLEDRYGNPGVDRLVNWATEIGTFVDTGGETLTDSLGYSHIGLRSLRQGTGSVSAWYSAGNASPEFFEVGFDDRPYIGSLVLASWAVAGDEIQVKATILGLDGEPAAGQAMTWTCTGAEVIRASTHSDEKGQAQAILRARNAGGVQVTLGLLTDDSWPLEYHYRELSFDVLADATLRTVWESGKWPMADGIGASEYEVHIFSSDGKPVERYPVTWTVEQGGIEPVVRLTGPEGIARFNLKSDDTGELTVIASWGDQQSHRFSPVTFLPPLQMEVLFDGETVDGPITITQPSTGTSTHTLTYRLAADHPLLNVPMNLLYSGRDSNAALGLAFSPALGADNRFVGREVTWQIVSSTTSLQHIAALRLGLTYDQAIAPLWTQTAVQPPRD
ncbi:Ig-like domain-containing protein [Pseudomonas sp. microsymbiont 2]